MENLIKAIKEHAIKNKGKSFSMILMPEVITWQKYKTEKRFGKWRWVEDVVDSRTREDIGHYFLSSNSNTEGYDKKYESKFYDFKELNRVLVPMGIIPARKLIENPLGNPDVPNSPATYTRVGGYILFLIVLDHVAKKIYEEEFLDAAFEFSTRIYITRNNVLNEMLKEFSYIIDRSLDVLQDAVTNKSNWKKRVEGISRYRKPGEIEYPIMVYKNGLKNPISEDYVSSENKIVLFDNYGMKSLETPAQQYGMAMAIAQILEKRAPLLQKGMITADYYQGYGIVKFNVPKELFDRDNQDW